MSMAEKIQTQKLRTNLAPTGAFWAFAVGIFVQNLDNKEEYFEMYRMELEGMRCKVDGRKSVPAHNGGKGENEYCILI